MQVDLITIAQRFCGPPKSGNGGYTCGLMAAHLPGIVKARLKAPPPLNTPLRLETIDTQARLYEGSTLIGEAQCSSLDLEPPDIPQFNEAQKASQSYVGFVSHAFPGCFVCGPDRLPGDGLRIFPGQVGATSILAAPWVPDSSLLDSAGQVKPEFLWSALDCTGAFAVLPEPGPTVIVLGELCAYTPSTVRAGEQCVVISWSLGADGRKRLAGSAIAGPDGRLIAIARAVWIEVSAKAWA